MKHLLVTNDFPPKIGGIQSLLWEWWRRLPPESFAVLTSPYAGTAEFDAGEPYRIERTREPVPAWSTSATDSPSLRAPSPPSMSRRRSQSWLKQTAM